VTIVAMKKQQVLYILSECACGCSHSYPACKAHALYYIVITGLSGFRIFFHIISQMLQFSEKKTLLNVKCVF
jgi:hypothetical protein